ncbi:MAG: PilZ domain-containing protein [Acidobacteriota bacterium]|nr:PilZ domain-containing protein [Acidobacteriota bacterium]
MTEQAPQPSKPETSRTVTRVSLVFESFRQFLREYGSHISMGGMFIGARRPLPPGSLCQLEFRLRDGYPLILGRGEVVWTRAREEGPGRPPGMGVRFHELEGSSRDLVFGIVEHRLAEGDSLFRLDEDGDLMDETPEDLDKLLKEAERRRERAESEARSSTIGSTQKLSAGAVLAEAEGDGEAAASPAEEVPIEAAAVEDSPVEDAGEFEPGDSEEELSLSELQEPGPREFPAESRDEPWEEASAVDAEGSHDTRETFAESPSEGVEDHQDPVLALPYDGDAVAEEEGWELEDARPEPKGEALAVPPENLSTGPSEVVSEEAPAERWDAGDLHSGTLPTAGGPSEDQPSDELAERRRRDDELGETLRDLPMPPLSEREPDLPVTVTEDEPLEAAVSRQTPPRGRPAAGLPVDSGDAMDLDQLFSVAPAADPLSMEDRPDPWTEREQQQRKRRRGVLGMVAALVVLAGAAFLLVRLVGWWPPSSDSATADSVASGSAQEASSEAGAEPSGVPITAEDSDAADEAPEVIDVGAEEPAAEASEPAAGSSAEPARESTPPPPASRAAASSVQDIRWTRSGNSTRVTVTLDGALPESRFTNQRLGSGAPRQLLRLRGITQAFRPPTLEVDTDQLLRIRTGRHIRDGVDELHLVLDLAAAGVTVTRVESRGRTLEIWVSSDS